MKDNRRPSGRKYKRISRFKRFISFTLVFALLATYLPADVSFLGLFGNNGNSNSAILKVQAAETDPYNTSKYLGNRIQFTSSDDFAEYSRCYKNDSAFAAAHANDTLIIYTGQLDLGDSFAPLGTADYPFAGTIYINGYNDASQLIVSIKPLFDYVNDDVEVAVIDTHNPVNLEFIRVEDVTAERSNPLFANHVYHGTGTSATWNIILSGKTENDEIHFGNDQDNNYWNSYSYSGTIGVLEANAVVNVNFTDNCTTKAASVGTNTGARLASKGSGDLANVGGICGLMKTGSSLTVSYTNFNGGKMLAGGEGNICSGGIVGKMEGASLVLTSASNLNFGVDSGNQPAGLIAGSVGKDSSNNPSSISLPDNLTLRGSVASTGERVGGLIGSLEGTDVAVAGTHSITLNSVTVTGGNKTGGIIGYFAPAANNSKVLTENLYTLSNSSSISGTNPGGIFGEYIAVGGETIDVSNFTFTNTTMSSGNAGGVFGKYTAAGDTTITGTFSAPSASTNFGGVIGEYTSGALARTLNLNSLIVNSVNQTADAKKLGGVILNVADSSYISVNNLTVGVTGGANKSNTSNPFGGIVSTLGSTAASGSFIDVVGNYTLTTSSAYNGGAIAGFFWNGVLRLAGTTDISGAKAANGYGQLIYDNDYTLVYSKGTGDNAAWTFKRNSSTTASDLGQWGEVVRFSNMETVIVDIAETAHTVTLKAASTSVTNPTTFAKLALNMQLNDGNSHGALLFAQGGDTKTTLLSSNSITFSGTIDLSGTGILGLMRDGGNGKYYNVNNNQNDSAMKGNPDYFTGTITGTNAEIKLAVGESYGTGNTNGGKIYLSHNNGHSAQGLLSFANGATISGLAVSGTMNVERVDNAGDALHMGAVMGYMTNGASLTNVSVSTEMDFTRTHQDGRIYIGGVAGLFDGDSTGKLRIIGGTASASAGSIAPKITLHGDQAAYSEDNYSNRNTYTGGILGLLGGKTTSQYSVEIKYTDVSPTITLGSDVADVNDQYCGGMIGRVRENTTNERTIEIDTVSMTNAEVQLKSGYSGGLLGTLWDRTQVTIDGLSVTGSKVENKHTASNLKDKDFSTKMSGMVFRATGKWNVNSLSISNTEFKAVSGAMNNSFGMIVNEGYHGNDGLYLNLMNSGYFLNGVTLPSSAKNDYYVDEIAANTASSKDAVVSGGNGVGIVNINMTTSSNTNVNITDIKDDTTGLVTVAGTGTYQNKALTNDKLISNQHARYYYNLDVIHAKSPASQEDGEMFLMWSIYNHYAPTNIQGYNVITNASLTGLTNVDLRGLSYYPVDISDVKLPAATFRFGFDDIMTLEAAKGTDRWARYPNSTGDMTTADYTRRNQHYLMQNSLFSNVTGTLNTSARITFAGVFGGLGDAGVLVGGTQTGNVDLKKGVTLSGIKPYSASSPMLVNYIDGTSADIAPEFYLSGLRQEKYPSTGTLAVASALINKAEGTNMKIIFSDIKLDARNGSTPDLNSVYGTSRSIFSDATLFKNLKSNATDTIEYNFTWDEDWGKDNGADHPKRNVTYGQEITNSVYYKDEEDSTKSGERRYSGTKRIFTNPTVDTDTEYDFTTYFLPYVKNKNKDATYNISEVKVNFVSSGLVEGCGTYNDPYIITSPKLLTKVANYINAENAILDTIRLPSEMNATWHTSDALYHKADSTKVATETASRYYVDSGETGIEKWTYDATREYLAGAYYIIPDDLTLTSDFPGIGKGGDSEKGKTVFHGVIVGRKKTNNEYPTITNPTANPFIYISNGTVVKNLKFTISAATSTPITISQGYAGNGADYTFSYKDMTATSNNKAARYYGGVIGEIMGGDNIIDGVTVTYSANRPIRLTGNNRQLIAVGGFVGAVVNGGLIFRGSNSVTGLTVYNNDGKKDTKVLGETDTANLYANPYVGRVINGYAVNEGTSTLDNTTKHYTIDNITPPTETNKLDVNGSSISVPNAQALFIMSLITQSTAGTATSANGDYGVSQSYGVNNSVFCGSNRLGTYNDVGSKKTVTSTVTDPDTGEETTSSEQVVYTNPSEVTDYNNLAAYDVANATDAVRQNAVPYIISAYTKAVSGAYPARTITYNSAKFWNVSLSESGSFDLSAYPSFRGIGCIGNKAADYNMKIATFDGNGKTIKLSMLESRYGRNAENYFHLENKSTTTAYSGDPLDNNNYGHDGNLQKVLGFGLFDYVNVKYDATTNPYQFQSFTIKGTIDEKVYDKTGADITGTDAQSQLFCIGGVVGKRLSEANSAGGYASDLNFIDIIFDGLQISGAYSCGGLIGIDALKTKKKMYIINCNSTANGVEVTGGFYGKSNDNSLRHGVGSFVGMTFLCRPTIDGDKSETAEIEKADIFVSKVSTHYNGNETRCNVGGLIGYSGTGAEIKNIKLRAANSNSVIGASNVANAAGFIGYAQAIDKYDAYNKNYSLANCLAQSVYIENCTLENISVRALNSAAGFYGRCNNVDWSPMYIYISDCSIIGDGDTKPEIRAYGSGTALDVNYVGGFVARFSTKLNVEHNTSIIQDSYISGYKVQGYNVGGIIGYKTQKPMNIRNVYVKDCDIVTYSNGNAGGFIGYSDQDLNGYNMKIENVNFLKADGSDNTAGAGAFIGNSSSKIMKFVAVAKYHSDITKIPSADIKSGTNTNNIVVFSDYTGQNLTTGKNTSNISSFGKTDIGGNITDQNKAPYLTLNPSSAMGTGEYISGDGAAQLSEALTGYSDYSSGKSVAARIYADSITDSPSNRAYPTTNLKLCDDTYSYKLDDYFKASADSDGYRVSTWNTEMGELSGVDDFTVLVINDNEYRKTTWFIQDYIKLMTNTNFEYYDDLSGKYRMVISPCKYNSNRRKFEIVEGSSGITTYNVGGKFYRMDISNPDSSKENQFTLFDIQYLDPTDTNRIAYHLYVPVLTKKTVTLRFHAATIPGTTYSAGNYVSKITSEEGSGKNGTTNPTQLVESMNVWTTSYIRYEYRPSEINELLKLDSDFLWNYDKEFLIERERENNIPDGTKMVLIDPNGDVDKAYYAVASTFNTTNNDQRIINLSGFTVNSDGTGGNFKEYTLYALLQGKIVAKSVASGSGAYVSASENETGAISFKLKDSTTAWYKHSASGNINLEIDENFYEDYYLSMYVPYEAGQADVVIIKPKANIGAVDSTGAVKNTGIIRGTVRSSLNSRLTLGDFFEHTIVKLDAVLEDENGNPQTGEHIVTSANKVLTTTTVAEISLKNDRGQATFFNTALSDSSISLYHSFNQYLTKHISATSSTNTISGITDLGISGTYQIGNGAVSSSTIQYNTENGYVQSDSGDIKSALLGSDNKKIRITGVVKMNFSDYTQEFPSNTTEEPNIGVQASVRSNIAFRSVELPYSRMFAMNQDNTLFYTKEDSVAKLSFDAVPLLDHEEIGEDTYNQSRLGVNRRFDYVNEIEGMSVYDVSSVKDTEYRNASRIRYTIHLEQKLPDGSGKRYTKVSLMSSYISGITLSDREVTLAPNNSLTTASEYVYEGTIDHSLTSDDRMFYADYKCTVNNTVTEYSNYRIVMTVELIGAAATQKKDYIVYTYAKINPEMIPTTTEP